MAAITTRSTRSLQHKLRQDYPAISFKKADTFYWSASEHAVFFNPAAPQWQSFLLHELAHGLLEHTRYHRDIQLLALERDAWAHAAHQLAPQYDTFISDELIQTNLDTYRDWLHSRSTCPRCQATGVQSESTRYTCLACHAAWRVNEARTCALRRHLV